MPGIHFCKDFLREMERRVRRRHAAINRALQQHFLNFIARDLVVQRGAHVHAKFVAAIERYHHGKRQQAARVAREARARPDFAPSVACNQILERLAEGILGGFGIVDMLIAWNCAAHFHSCGMTLTLVHYFASCWPRNFSSAAVNASAASIFERCAAFSSRYSAPGIFPARNRPSAAVTAASCAPEITSVGNVRRDTCSRKSSSRSAAQVAT